MKKLQTTTDSTDELLHSKTDENELKWEQNHAKISDAILIYFSKMGTIPPKSHIADVTGISRETVRKHMKSFSENSTYQAQLEGYSMMISHVIGKVFRASIGGDLQAAKLFLETIRPSVDKEKKASAQNNYLQINKTVINQQIIQQLKPEQLKRIELVIAKELEEKTGG